MNDKERDRIIDLSVQIYIMGLKNGFKIGRGKPVPLESDIIKCIVNLIDDYISLGKHKQLTIIKGGKDE